MKRLPEKTNLSLRSRVWRSRILFFTAAPFLLLGVSRAVSAQDGPSLVVLVRHAEKAAQPAADPPLTDAGTARALALADAVAHSAPTAIIVTATKRTADTAIPSATKFGVTPLVISLAGGGATHITAVAEAVRQQRGVVLVIGHSNTIPAVIRALGGPTLPDICDNTYNLLFILQPARDGHPAALIVSQYGAEHTVPSSNTPMNACTSAIAK